MPVCENAFSDTYTSLASSVTVLSYGGLTSYVGRDKRSDGENWTKMHADVRY